RRAADHPGRCRAPAEPVTARLLLAQRAVRHAEHADRHPGADPTRTAGAFGRRHHPHGRRALRARGHRARAHARPQRTQRMKLNRRASLAHMGAAGVFGALGLASAPAWSQDKATAAPVRLLAAHPVVAALTQTLVQGTGIEVLRPAPETLPANRL